MHADPGLYLRTGREAHHERLEGDVEGCRIPHVHAPSARGGAIQCGRPGVVGDGNVGHDVRLGFAGDIFGNGSTSLRGGYGMAYERNFGNVTFNVIQNPPNNATVAISAGTDVPDWYFERSRLRMNRSNHLLSVRPIG